MPTVDGITFYPVLKYRGYRVTPQWWHPESSEPLLLCHLDGSEISGFGDGEEGYKRRSDELIADGWQWDYRHGGTKYLHVDELEKIEGPPPEGAF